MITINLPEENVIDLYRFFEKLEKKQLKQIQSLTEKLNKTISTKEYLTTLLPQTNPITKTKSIIEEIISKEITIPAINFHIENTEKVNITNTTSNPELISPTSENTNIPTNKSVSPVISSEAIQCKNKYNWKTKIFEVIESSNTPLTSKEIIEAIINKYPELEKERDRKQLKETILPILTVCSKRGEVLYNKIENKNYYFINNNTLQVITDEIKDEKINNIINEVEEYIEQKTSTPLLDDKQEEIEDEDFEEEEQYEINDEEFDNKSQHLGLDDDGDDFSYQRKKPKISKFKRYEEDEFEEFRNLRSSNAGYRKNWDDY